MSFTSWTWWRFIFIADFSNRCRSAVGSDHAICRSSNDVDRRTPRSNSNSVRCSFGGSSYVFRCINNCGSFSICSSFGSFLDGSSGFSGGSGDIIGCSGGVFGIGSCSTNPIGCSFGGNGNISAAAGEFAGTFWKATAAFRVASAILLAAATASPFLLMTFIVVGDTSVFVNPVSWSTRRVFVRTKICSLPCKYTIGLTLYSICVRMRSFHWQHGCHCLWSVIELITGSKKEVSVF